MKAVNLIPGDARRRGPTSSAGLPFLGLVGGLVLVLLATVLLVTAHNRVSSRESQLHATTAAAARWSAAAGGYTHDVALEKQRGVTISMVTGLADQRYQWSELLNQLASSLPRTTILSSLTSAAGASGTTPTPSGTSTPPTTSATGSSTTASSSAPSQITLAACAPSQSGVAQTIVNLRRVRGVTGVLLSSTSAGSGSAGGGSSTACGNVTFGLTLTFADAASTASTAAAGASPTPSSTGVSQ